MVVDDLVKAVDDDHHEECDRNDEEPEYQALREEVGSLHKGYMWEWLKLILAPAIDVIEYDSRNGHKRPDNQRDVELERTDDSIILELLRAGTDHFLCVG